MSDIVVVLKKCRTRHLRGTSFKLARISTIATKYCDKQLSHCPGYFFVHLAILLLQSKVHGRKPTMESIAWYNGETSHEWVLKVNRDSWRFFAN